ncbi:hypothetical protein K438DRAFT_682557 [Mycena galopus ATCC 62051]|nr:hypothetical protein K438DRAFT_682557 [Mycena galopus ATCC 62051]
MRTHTPSASSLAARTPTIFRRADTRSSVAHLLRRSSPPLHTIDADPRAQHATRHSSSSTPPQLPLHSPRPFLAVPRPHRLQHAPPVLHGATVTTSCTCRQLSHHPRRIRAWIYARGYAPTSIYSPRPVMNDAFEFLEWLVRPNKAPLSNVWIPAIHCREYHHMFDYTIPVIIARHPKNDLGFPSQKVPMYSYTVRVDNAILAGFLR